MADFWAWHGENQRVSLNCELITYAEFCYKKRQHSTRDDDVVARDSMWVADNGMGIPAIEVHFVGRDRLSLGGEKAVSLARRLGILPKGKEG